MKITYTTTSYPPALGGAQIHLHKLAHAIKSIGHTVNVETLWSTYRNDWLTGSTIFCRKSNKYSYQDIEVNKIGFSTLQRVKMLPWVITYYPLISVSVKKISDIFLNVLDKELEQPDIIHSTRIGREFITRASLEYSKRNDIPFVLTPVHHQRWNGYIYKEYDKIYREADALIALTEAEKSILVNDKGVDEKKIHITGIGPILSDSYDTKNFRKKYNIEGRFVLFLGQKYKYKGIKSILESAPIVWQEHPDVNFIFIGPNTKYSNKLFKNVYDDRIRNINPVDLFDKTSALAACDLFCMPSAQESFGGVYVEAWSFRKPVIGGKIPQISCIIEENINGLLSSQDKEELSKKIIFLLNNTKKANELGDSGWRNVQTYYSWERIANKTQDVYESLIP